MSVGFDITFKFPNWLEKLQRSQDEINLFIAAMMQTNRGELFDKEGASNGHEKWAPLKFRRGQILSDKGILRKSMAPFNANGRPGPDGIVMFQGDVITIGTKLFYAKMMNDGTAKMPGGVLRPVNAKALKIPVPGGAGATAGAKKLRKSAYGDANNKFIFRKSVRIPERRFDTWTQEDEQEITEATMNKIMEVLNRG